MKSRAKYIVKNLITCMMQIMYIYFKHAGRGARFRESLVLVELPKMSSFYAFNFRDFVRFQPIRIHDEFVLLRLMRTGHPILKTQGVTLLAPDSLREP